MTTTDYKELMDRLEGMGKWLNKKGYTGYFLTNGAYPDRFVPSARAYLKAALLGKEKDPSRGLVFSTYLDWQGPDRPRTMGRLRLEPGEDGKPCLSEFLIEYLDQRERPLGTKSIRVRDLKDLPSRKLAVKMAAPKGIRPPKRRSHGI